MLETYYNISKAFGVSINLLQNGEILISACGITINKDKLDIDSKILDLISIEGLEKRIPQKSYVAINLSGKGVLQKQIERTDQISQQNFNQILPNATFSDFYIQNFISGDKSFISIIRKAEADKWIEVLRKLNLIPLSVSLGCFAVSNIQIQLNSYDNEIVFD